MDLRAWLTRDRGKTKRQEYIEEHGRDPKTNLTVRPMELSEEIRPRGGKKSIRRTARVWVPAEQSPSD